MPASILTLQISDPDAKDLISAIIWSETESLSSEVEVSIFDSGHDDIWDLVIKQPKRVAATRHLYADQGDLTPAVFRIRFRELLRLL